MCYNPVDLDNNKKAINQARINAIGSLGNAMNGHHAASAVQYITKALKTA